MRFSEIPGYEELKNQWILSIKNDRVSHAQLLLGKSGGANLPLALALISYLLCENKSDVDSCGQCTACHQTDKWIHPDVQFIFPVAAGKNSDGKTIKEDDVVSQSYLKEWRSFLNIHPFPNIEQWIAYFSAEGKQVSISKEESRQIIKNVSLKSFSGSYKCILIWLPEFLHPYAANALLKILEEPPFKTLFLLVSCNYEGLINTIISRTQYVQIPDLTVNEMKVYFTQNQIPMPSDEVFSLSEGSLGTALASAQEDNDDIQQSFTQWLRDCYSGQITVMVSFADEFNEWGKNQQKIFLSKGIAFLRLCLVAPYGLHSSQDESIARFSKNYTSESIFMMVKALEEAIYHLERNANSRILALDLSLSFNQWLSIRE